MFDRDMSDEKKEKLTAKLKELGVDESKIDERMMWSYKKASFGLVKLRLVLEDQGIDEAKAGEIIDKVVAKAKEKDLSKVREWHEQHHADRHEWHGKHHADSQEE
jgi:hypothetical protein